MKFAIIHKEEVVRYFTIYNETLGMPRFTAAYNKQALEPSEMVDYIYDNNIDIFTFLRKSYPSVVGNIPANKQEIKNAILFLFPAGITFDDLLNT